MYSGKMFSLPFPHGSASAGVGLRKLASWWPSMCLSNIAIEVLVASTGSMLGCSTRSCTPVINKQKHAC